VHFPGAAKIVLVQDNLNTPKPASLYEAFPAAEARRLVARGCGAGSLPARVSRDRQFAISPMAMLVPER
jgi:hypothetical protein